MESRNPGTPLTREEREKIMEMFFDGERICKIARTVGRSEHAVRHTISNNGYSKRRHRLDPEEELAIERMVLEGLDDITIATMLNISASVVKVQRKSIDHFHKMIDKNRKAGDSPKEPDNTEDELLEFLKEDTAYNMSPRNKGKKAGYGKFLYERPMIFRGTYRNAHGKLLFVFESSTGGWVETFTAEQLKDITAREEVDKCQRDTRKCGTLSLNRG